MAQRRMFSPQIVESEEFLTMPVSSQALYFHLGMHADDDGFIQPKIVMRTTGANEDDLKVLLAKRFLLAFEQGVVVIKHWLIHNLIQKDRYHPTRFQEEKKTLFIKVNKAYTDNPDSVNKMLPEVRLGKVRLGKKDIAPASGADVSLETKKKGLDDDTPMSREEFVEWCRKSPQRHIRLIAEYADEKKIGFKTKGQWRSFVSRNVRPARLLKPYDDDQISDAMKRLERDEVGNGNDRAFITKWSLETLAKYLQ